MAWMKCEGDTGRLVWQDRMQARQRLDARTVRRGREWVTVPARRTELSGWRDGSSRVTTEAVER